MMRQRPPVEPKPFALVQIPTEEPKREQATWHNAFGELTGRLEVEIRAESEYLFVGSGSYEFDPGARGNTPDVWHTFYRQNGQVRIPGTSIKGAIRAIVEAISNSCLLQTRREEHRNKRFDHKACQFRDGKGLCPACRLFGTTGYRGRVSFSDASSQNQIRTERVKIGELWEPKRWDRSRRFYAVKKYQPIPNQRPERNFRFVEAVPKGSQFHTSIRFENLNKPELGLLCHALGWKAENGKVGFAFTPKIGGAKSRCFGAVRFLPRKLHLLQDNILVSHLKYSVRSDEELSGYLVECLETCERSDLLHGPSWDSLKRGLQLQNETCPRELY